MLFIFMFGLVQEEVMRVFYVNIFDINNEENSFWMVVCNTPMQVNPTILSQIFGVPHPPTPIAYLIHRLTLEQKGGIVEWLYCQFVN